LERQLSFRDERNEELKQQIAEIHNNRHPLGIVLAQLDDPRNIGMIFRLADAARLAHLWILGNDASLLHNRKFKRVARSTVNYVPYSFLNNVDDITAIPNEYKLIGLEVTSHSTPINEFVLEEPVALIVGNEERGISPALLDRCEQCVHLPMYGINTSMNVAMATGIAAYSLIHQG
jgi:tRNA G18 (ribose-2'-O)-methylase SpoU